MRQKQAKVFGGGGGGGGGRRRRRRRRRSGVPGYDIRYHNKSESVTGD